MNTKIKFDKKGQFKKYGWLSGYFQPSNKFWKRIAAKKVRKSLEVANGNSYKKFYGPMEWS